MFVCLALLAGCADQKAADDRKLTQMARAWGINTPVTLEGHEPIRKGDAASGEKPAPEPSTTAQILPIVDETPETGTVEMRGSGRFVTEPSSRIATQDDGDEGVSLNFRNADLEDVVESIIGKILNENYIIDPAVSGQVTLQTSRPIPRATLLETLDNALRVNGATLIRRADLYEVRPVSAHANGHLSPVTVGRQSDGGLGHGTHIVPLRHVGARALKEAIMPLVPQGAAIEADPARNILLVTGGAPERAKIIDLVNSFDVDWMAGMSFALVPLQAASADAITQELSSVFQNTEDGLSADMVRFIALERLNAVLVMAKSPSYLDKVNRWIATFDRGSQDDGRRVYIYPVEHGRASDLALMLGGIFDAQQQTLDSPGTAPGANTVNVSAGGAGGAEGGEGTGILRRVSAPEARSTKLVISNDRMRIVADDEQNTLAILARPADYTLLVSSLRQLDKTPVQVLIEATIAEVALNDELRFGLQWFFESGDFQGLLTTSRLGDVSQVFPGFNLLFQGSNARVILDALDSISDVEVVSSPQVVVLNNQPAVLSVGDQVPIVTRSSVSVQDPDAPLVNSLEYRDTGVILEVRPRVNSSDLVVLHVLQEVSDVVQTTTSGIDSPTIQQRIVESHVAVKSGQTIALGGLIRESMDDSRTGLPMLARIPVLGALFGSTTKRRERTELLVLITPHVLKTSTDIDAATNELKDRLSTMEVMLGG